MKIIIVILFTFFIIAINYSSSIAQESQKITEDKIAKNHLSCWSRGKLILSDELDSVDLSPFNSSKIKIKGKKNGTSQFYFSMNENTICRLKMRKTK